MAMLLATILMNALTGAVAITSLRMTVSAI